MLIASMMMLVAMTFASCKSSNKPAAEEARTLGEVPVRGSVIVTTVDAKLYAIPADAAALFGPESYHLHDYGFFYNNLKQNVADRIKAFLEKQ